MSTTHGIAWNLGTVKLATVSLQGVENFHVIVEDSMQVWAFNKPALMSEATTRFMRKVAEGLNEGSRPRHNRGAWTMLCTHCMTDGDEGCYACNYDGSDEETDGERAFERSQALREGGFF